MRFLLRLHFAFGSAVLEFMRRLRENGFPSVKNDEEGGQEQEVSHERTDDREGCESSYDDGRPKAAQH